jgi:hypothetical protein
MIAADERRARAPQGGVPWTEDPERFDVFARLPAVMRLLRMEAGESPAQLDVRLGLPRGSSRRRFPGSESSSSSAPQSWRKSPD